MRALSIAVVVACVSISLVTPSLAQVFPTPRWIERCEEIVADLILRPADKPYSETEARSWAITLFGCDERRLLDRQTKAFIAEGQLQPYFDAYAEDMNVWKKK